MKQQGRLDTSRGQAVLLLIIGSGEQIASGLGYTYGSAAIPIVEYFSKEMPPEFAA